MNKISAWMDGELDEHQAREQLARVKQDEDLARSWNTFHVIGDALRGERVLSRREAQSYGAGGGVNVTIMARDAESFRQSRTQVAADIARAVSLGRRGM